MDESLKTMVLKAVDSTYVFCLHNVFTGYMGSKTKYIINHLMTRYRQIKAAYIEDKKPPPSRTLVHVAANWFF